VACKTSAEIERGFRKKGFTLVRNSGHKIYAPTDRDGNQIATISVPVSRDKKKEYSGNLLSRISKETGLGVKDFLDLIDCPLSKNEYIEKIGR
jgi:predicted RNA binding protein YcfA (HicA-like mRNA interferase family)